MYMGRLSFLIVKKRNLDTVDSKIDKDLVFQTLELPDDLGRVYLLNSGISAYELDLSDEDYLYVELDDEDKIGFSGAWTDGLAGDLCSIYGSMTFIISEIDDEDHFFMLRDLYGGLWVNSNLETVESFMAHGVEYVDNFVESYDEENPESNEAKEYWELIQELSNESGDDFYTVIQTLVISYAFYQLGISVEADNNNHTLICSLDGMVSLQKFLAYKDVLEDEMSELEEGDSYQFAYSLWTKSGNTELFESLGLDNGDYLSYPTLKVGNFSGELETGYWY